MSQPETHAHPARRRAGFLSALSKLYSKILRLIETDGTTEEGLEMQQTLQERYARYLESHEEALVLLPERESSLNTSHIDVDRRHLEIGEQLQAYIDDGTKTERSLHVRSLFSSRLSQSSTSKTVSNKQSSRHSSRSVVSQAKSDRLSEARVQAELAKTNIAKQKALKEAHQKKIAAEREAARQQLEFERLAAQEKAEMEREAARRQFELDEQKRIRDEEIKQKDIQRQLLKEETERQHRELEEELETQRQLAEYDKLRAEVKIREREEMRSILGSDYESSDDEREDVTRCKTGPKQTLGFQDIEKQQTRHAQNSHSRFPNHKMISKMHA